MKALLKGTGVIYETQFSQDSTGGRVETKIPLLTLPFVGRQLNRFENTQQGREGTQASHRFWCECPLDLTTSNVEEAGWIDFNSQCYDIIAVTLVANKHNKYGFEIDTVLRK